MALNSIEELVEDIRQGKMVILMDDEDRENEGDLIMASECVKAEHINFMARYARGLICMPMTRERCELLKLPLMAPRNGSGLPNPANGLRMQSLMRALIFSTYCQSACCQ